MKLSNNQRDVIRKNERCQTPNRWMIIPYLPYYSVRSASLPFYQRSRQSERSASRELAVNVRLVCTIWFRPMRIGCTGAALTVARGACTCLPVYGARTYCTYVHAGLYARDLSIPRYIFRARCVFRENACFTSERHGPMCVNLSLSRAVYLRSIYICAHVVLVFFSTLPRGNGRKRLTAERQNSPAAFDVGGISRIRLNCGPWARGFCERARAFFAFARSAAPRQRPICG